MYVKHQVYLFWLGFKECISVANLWWNQGSPLSWDIQRCDAVKHRTTDNCVHIQVQHAA